MNINSDVLKHISSFDETIQSRFLSIRQVIINKLPDAEEKLGYGVPGYYVKGKNVMYVACFKGHIGIYPGSDYIEKHQALLKDYKTSKGTIQISHKQDIPFELITDILTYKGFE